MDSTIPNKERSYNISNNLNLQERRESNNFRNPPPSKTLNMSFHSNNINNNNLNKIQNNLNNINYIASSKESRNNISSSINRKNNCNKLNQEILKPQLYKSTTNTNFSNMPPIQNRPKDLRLNNVFAHPNPSVKVSTNNNNLSSNSNFSSVSPYRNPSHERQQQENSDQLLKNEQKLIFTKISIINQIFEKAKRQKQFLIKEKRIKNSQDLICIFEFNEISQEILEILKRNCSSYLFSKSSSSTYYFGLMSANLDIIFDELEKHFPRQKTITLTITFMDNDSEFYSFLQNSIDESDIIENKIFN